MEKQIDQEKIKREMDRLEVFLRSIRAKYERENRAICIYGNVYETTVHYLRDFEEMTSQIKVEIEEGKLLDITPNKGFIGLEIWDRGNLRIEIIHSMNYIMTLKDSVYIFF